MRCRTFPHHAERGFCSRCGSPLFFRSKRWTGELHIARALLTDVPDREPSTHAFCERVSLGETLPRKHSDDSTQVQVPAKEHKL